MSIVPMSLALAVLAWPAGASAASTDRSCMGEAATIVAGAYEVSGTAGDDVIVDLRGGGLIEAGAGDDLVCVRSRGFHEIYGARGDDRIAGGRGEDFAYPQAGDDRARLGRGADLITDEVGRGDDRYAGGRGSDEIRFSVPFRRGRARAVRVDLRRGRSSGRGRDRFSGIESVEGTARPDTIIGDAGDNLLDGVRGADRIAGRGGDDTILGAGVLITEAGDALGRFDGSDPSLRGGRGADRIFGRAGRDRLAGGPGADLLDGGGPHDPPGDRGSGGAGRDRCRDLERAAGCE